MRVGQHQPAVDGRRKGLRDRHGGVPAVPSVDDGAGEGADPWLPYGALVRAPRRARRRLPPPGEPALRAEGEQYRRAVLGPLHRRAAGR